jgi:hypothetical protein
MAARRCFNLGQVEPYKVRPEETRFSKRAYLKEVRRGALITSGMALLWLLEIARNFFFALLDRIGFPVRRRARVSAFPPGRPRKRTT